MSVFLAQRGGKGQKRSIAGRVNRRHLAPAAAAGRGRGSADCRYPDVAAIVDQLG